MAEIGKGKPPAVEQLAVASPLPGRRGESHVA